MAESDRLFTLIDKKDDGLRAFNPLLLLGITRCLFHPFLLTTSIVRMWISKLPHSYMRDRSSESGSSST